MPFCRWTAATIAVPPGFSTLARLLLGTRSGGSDETSDKPDRRGGVAVDLERVERLARDRDLGGMTAFGRNPPSLSDGTERPADPEVGPERVGLIKALAVLANACIAGFCLLILSVVWTSLVRRMGWALWALGGAMGLVQVFGFVSDAYIGNENVLANAISTGVLIGGIALSRVGYARGSGGHENVPEVLAGESRQRRAL
jgi:hypothetical protein